jgi:hypothetical protein
MADLKEIINDVWYHQLSINGGTDEICGLYCHGVYRDRDEIDEILIDVYHHRMSVDDAVELIEEFM